MTKAPVPNVDLPPDLVEYRDTRPPAKGVDRSGMELKIVSALQRSGCSDEEIFAYFDHYELPRYVAEGKSKSWLQSLIRTSKKSAKSVQEVTQQPLRVIGNDHNPRRHYRDGFLVHRILRVRAAREKEGEEKPILTKWRQEIIEVSGEGDREPVSMRTAQRMSARLVDKEYVRLEPLNKKSKLVVLTEKGWKASKPLAKWGRYINLWGTGSSSVSTAVLDEEAPDHESPQEPRPHKRTPTRHRRRSVSAAQERVNRITSLRKDSQINGYHRIRFKGNKIRYLQLLTAPDDWALGRLWMQLQVEFDREGLPQYVTMLGEENPDEDPISVLVPWSAHDQVLALAAELEKSNGGYQLAEYVNEAGELLPAVGLIVQSHGNFFGPLLAQPQGKIYRVQGSGKEKTRRYSFSAVADALPIAVDIDFGRVLDDISDPAHRERIAKLAPGWFHMPPKRKALVQQLLS